MQAKVGCKPTNANESVKTRERKKERILNFVDLISKEIKLLKSIESHIIIEYKVSNYSLIHQISYNFDQKTKNKL